MCLEENGMKTILNSICSRIPGYHLIILFLLLISISYSISYADEMQIEELAEFSLEELMEIEITSASKKSEKVSQAPASAFVITRDDIRRYGYRNLQEALNRVTGFYVSSDRNYEYLGVRGFSRPGDYNTRILLLVDGHRINDTIYDFAPIEEDFTVDIESIERIEIVKGPGSALWGTNALLAVVNVITQKGSDLDGGSVQVEYGSHERKKGFIEFGKLFDNGFEFAGSLSHLESDGQNLIYFKEFDDPLYNNGVADGLDDTEAARGYLSASYEGFRLFFNKGRRKKSIPTASYETVFNEDGTFTLDESTHIELSYEKNVIESINGQLMIRLYHDIVDYNGDWIYDYEEPTLAVNKDYTDMKSWGTEVRFSMNPTSRLSLTTGIEYLDAYELKQVNYDDDPYYYEYTDTNNSYNLKSYYLQAGYQLFDSLRLVAGIRLDDYSTFGDSWSPRAALIYTPFERSTFKLLYGEAFRAPNDYEMNYYAQSYEEGNPSLEPEEIKTWELIWEQKLWESTRLVTSLFRYELNDIITQVETENELLQFQNLGTVVSEGVEVQLESRFKNDLTAHLGFTVLDVEDENTGKRPANSPGFMAGGGISIPVWSKRFYLSPEIQYIGERKTLSRDEVDASAVANFTIASGAAFHPFDVSVSAYNVFDEDVYVPGGEEHLHDQIPQDGRTFRFRFSYHF